MSIHVLRQDLEAIREHAQAGELEGVVDTVDHALSTLDANRLMTTSEAAALLGIRSVNTLKLLARRHNLPYQMHGNRMMIPIGALERLQDSADVRGIHAADAAHDDTAHLGDEHGLDAGELGDLAAQRPGELPWHQ